MSYDSLMKKYVILTFFKQYQGKYQKFLPENAFCTAEESFRYTS